MIISQFPARRGGTEEYLSLFDYSGSYAVVGDTEEEQQLRFLSSGTLKLHAGIEADLFLVGGGGGGGSSGHGQYVGRVESKEVYTSYNGGGGGGGYTLTARDVELPAGVYTVTVGEGGQTSPYSFDGGASSFIGNSVSYTAQGGKTAQRERNYPIRGGDGGSGGGGGSQSFTEPNIYAGARGGAGGQDGAYGQGDLPGAGQGRTTRAFEEEDGELFASGGSGTETNAQAAGANTGNGGSCGVYTEAGIVHGQAGGSGIVILRLAKE